MSHEYVTYAGLVKRLSDPARQEHLIFSDTPIGEVANMISQFDSAGLKIYFQDFISRHESLRAGYEQRMGHGIEPMPRPQMSPERAGLLTEALQRDVDIALAAHLLIVRDLYTIDHTPDWSEVLELAGRALEFCDQSLFGQTFRDQFNFGLQVERSDRIYDDHGPRFTLMMANARNAGDFNFPSQYHFAQAPGLGFVVSATQLFLGHGARFGALDNFSISRLKEVLDYSYQTFIYIDWGEHVDELVRLVEGAEFTFPNENWGVENANVTRLCERVAAKDVGHPTDELPEEISRFLSRSLLADLVPDESPET